MDTHKSFTLSFSNQSVQQRQLEESFRSTVDAAVSPMTDPKLARSLLSNAYAMEQLILCSRSNKRRFMASGLRDDAKTRSHPYPSRRQAPSNHRFALLVSSTRIRNVSGKSTLTATAVSRPRGVHSEKKGQNRQLLARFKTRRPNTPPPKKSQKHILRSSSSLEAHPAVSPERGCADATKKAAAEPSCFGCCLLLPYWPSIDLERGRLPLYIPPHTISHFPIGSSAPKLEAFRANNPSHSLFAVPAAVCRPGIVSLVALLQRRRADKNRLLASSLLLLFSACGQVSVLFLSS
ncbi:hypothetical protein BHM03_00006079 [Ensete ventricosum]|uniref:Uncharacterized protein n=1 Tax=Ensete ventricosum TaxID=4639 RepID=A0A445MBL2_ENSVE|nr:hypothetical protein BHM03_00006079 [Ensete ventricosum]